MKFIKLGAAYINMDLVTDIWVDDDHISVFLAVPMMYTAIPVPGTSNAITTRTLQFSGAEAAALLDWLENKSKAKDISPPSSKKKDAPTTTHRSSTSRLILSRPTTRATASNTQTDRLRVRRRAHATAVSDVVRAAT